ncbi:MAG: RHS repeat-associated core domain-containing protein [Bacteroidota bacterium]
MLAYDGYGMPHGSTPTLLSPSAGAVLLPSSNQTFCWSHSGGGVYDYHYTLIYGTYTTQLGTKSVTLAPNAPTNQGCASIDTQVFNPGQAYWWKVQRQVYSSTTTSAQRSFTMQSPPPPPALNSPLGTTGTITALRWHPVTGATGGYTIQVDDQSNYSSPLVNVTTGGTPDQGNTLRYNLTAALVPGRTYYWRVRALGVGGLQSNWAASTFKDMPDRVTLMQPSTSGQLVSGLTFRWNKVHNIVSTYQIRLATNSSFSGATTHTDVGQPYYSTAIDYVWPQTLAYGTTYYWQVRAKGENNTYGPWSSTMSFTTRPATPGTPGSRSPHVTGVGTLTPTLNWAAVSNATWYNVRLEQGGTLLWSSGTSGTSVTVSSGHLSNGNSYVWKVQACNSAASPSCSGWGSATFTTPPAQVSLSSPSSGTTSAPWPTLYWNAAANASSYDIEVSTSVSNFSGNIIQSWYSYSGTSVTVSLEYNDGYYWRVRGRDAYGNTGSWSGIRSIQTTSGYTSNQLPAHGTTNVTASGNVDFVWTKVHSKLYEYQIEIRRQSSNAVVYSTSGVGQHYNPQSSWAYHTVDMGGLNLALNTNYIWRVRINGANGAGTWSAYTTFKTENPAVITVGNPAPGATVLPGDNQFVSWGANNVHPGMDFTLAIVRDGVALSSAESGLSATSPASPTYNYWNVPADLQAGERYRLRVSQGGTVGESGEFTVPKRLRVVSPAEGATFQAGQRVRVEWTENWDAASSNETFHVTLGDETCAPQSGELFCEISLPWDTPSGGYTLSVTAVDQVITHSQTININSVALALEAPNPEAAQFNWQRGEPLSVTWRLMPETLPDTIKMKVTYWQRDSLDPASLVNPPHVLYEGPGASTTCPSGTSEAACFGTSVLAPGNLPLGQGQLWVTVADDETIAVQSGWINVVTDPSAFPAVSLVSPANGVDWQASDTPLCWLPATSGMPVGTVVNRYLVRLGGVGGTTQWVFPDEVNADGQLCYTPDANWGLGQSITWGVTVMDDTGSQGTFTERTFSVAPVEFLEPTDGHQWVLNQPTTIRWNANSGAGPFTLELYRVAASGGGTTGSALVTQTGLTDATTSHTFTPHLGIGFATEQHYRVRLTKTGTSNAIESADVLVPIDAERFHLVPELAAYDFGEVPLSYEPERLFALSNTGSGTLRGTIRLSTDPTHDGGVFRLRGAGFLVQANSFTYAIEPGQPLLFSVSFRPTQLRAAPYTQQLLIDHDDADATSPHTVDLTAEAVERPAGERPKLTLSPSTGPIDFGTVTAGYTRRLDYQIANDGLADLEVDYTFDTDWGLDFALLVDEAPVTFAGALVLEPDSTHVLSVVFQPGAPTTGSAMRGTLRLSHTDLEHPAGRQSEPGAGGGALRRVVTLVHEGKAEAAQDDRHFVLAPDVAQLDFGALEAGQTAPYQTLRVSNPGTEALTLRFDLCNRVDFSLAIDGTPWSEDPETAYAVAPGTERALSLSFHPQSMGSKLCVLSVSHDDGDVAPSVWQVQLYGVGQDPGRKRYYYVSDHLGSLRATVNEGGEVVGRDDYYPFGLQQAGRSVVEGTRTTENYTGHELDTEAGLLYAGARYYDPVVARWGVVDPLADKYAAFSPYNYVLNNPLVLTDPTGEEPCCSALFAAAYEFVNRAKVGLSYAASKIAEKYNSDPALQHAVEQTAQAASAIDPTGTTDLAIANIRGLSGDTEGYYEGVASATLAGGGRLAGVFADGVKATSVKQFGHTFKKHGSGTKITGKLLDRARQKNTQQGQWLSNDDAASFLSQYSDITEVTEVDIPSGLGQVIMPNGEIVSATRARLVPKPEGGFRTAFPITDSN